MGRDVLTRPAPRADERIRYGDDPSHFGDLRLPPGPGPHRVVAYLHGGCWRAEYDLAHAGHICAALTAAGLATWSLEYRRLGNGGGWPATFLDVARALDHLRALAGTYRLDLGRVVVAGHSAGGHLAAWLASRSRLPAGDPLRGDPLALRGAVPIAGLVDLARSSELGLCGGSVDALLGGAPAKVPGRYALASPFELLPLGVAQVLVSGGRDTIAPVEIAERYAARATRRGDDVRLVTIAEADHFDLIDPTSPFFPAVRDAVLSLLAR
jgi:acetyl esterase/lipase